eukprot:618497-Rhodomonas_salina.1
MSKFSPQRRVSCPICQRRRYAIAGTHAAYGTTSTHAAYGTASTHAAYGTTRHIRHCPAAEHPWRYVERPWYWTPVRAYAGATRCPGLTRRTAVQTDRVGQRAGWGRAAANVHVRPPRPVRYQLRYHATRRLVLTQRSRTLPGLRLSTVTFVPAGDFYEPRNANGRKGPPVKTEPEQHCGGEEAEESLWRLSTAAVGDFDVTANLNLKPHEHAGGQALPAGPGPEASSRR